MHQRANKDENYDLLHVNWILFEISEQLWYKYFEIFIFASYVKYKYSYGIVLNIWFKKKSLLKEKKNLYFNLRIYLFI